MKGSALEHSTIWVCVDCMLTESTGEEQESMDREPWSLVTDAHQTTPGLVFEEHDDNCPNFDSDGEYLGDSDCTCETQEFSWSRCEGCGSTLGGSRYAYTVWHAV